MTEGLHLAALLLYGAAAVLMGVSFARNAARLPTIASGSLGAGLLLHSWALFEFTRLWDELPLVGLGPFLSSLAYLIGLGTLIASTLGHALTVGLVLIPVVVVMLGVAVGVGVAPAGEAQAFQSIWLVLHVLLALVGYVGLTMAFAAGLMYLLQFRELKSKHFGAIFRFFPPLETLDRLGRLGLILGFPALTLALLVAWAWTTRFQAVAAPGMDKLVWVIVSWFVFVGAIVARLGGGRRGHRGALASVVGFVVVVIVYLVMRVQSSGGAFLLSALYPVLLDLAATRVLVVGGGAVAARKVDTLVEFGGRPEIVAPTLLPRLAATVERLGLTLHERGYEPGDARGFQVAIAATDRPEVNSAVAAEARALGIWVNVVDDPDASTFHVPATVRAGEVTVALSTGGASPLLARRLRERMEGVVTPGLGRTVERLRETRAEVQARWPEEEERRRAFWFALITQEFLDSAIAGRDEEVESRIEACLSRS